MKAIIVAAGPSSRLRPLTDNMPKCMLNLNGKPIIQNMIELFRKNGINDISIVRGYKKEKINFQGMSYFENSDFLNNNILHSLMYARLKLEETLITNEDVIISYSDIFYNQDVLKKLLDDNHNISAIVDVDWQDSYDGRTDHPTSEAEKVIVGKDSRMLKIGKHIFTNGIPKNRQGEFIGLSKFTPEGTGIFLKHFDRLNSSLRKTDPFQSAKEWQKSYITDIFQEIIDKKEEIYCVLIKKGWKEIDTVQDFLSTKGKMPKEPKLINNGMENEY